jgi:hypothetical protein
MNIRVITNAAYIIPRARLEIESPIHILETLLLSTELKHKHRPSLLSAFSAINY